MKVLGTVLKIIEAVLPPVCMVLSTLAAYENKIDYAIYFVVIGIFVRVNRKLS